MKGIEPGTSGAESGFAGLILAAGRSTRMAEGSKLLSDFRGIPVIHRVVATALAADLDPIVVVVRNDARALRSSLQGLPVCFAAVRGEREGRLVSVVTGIEAFADRAVAGVMILLGDEPGLTADHVRAVRGAHDAGKPITARARFRDRPGHPVLLPAPSLQSLPDLARQYGPDAGLWEVIVRSGVAHRSVPIDDLSPIDVDTRGDLARALEREADAGR